MNVVMRDHHNDTVDHRVLSENEPDDPYHPMSGIDPSSLSGINGGTHVALSALDLNQVKCRIFPGVSDGAPGNEGGKISDGGTFHTIIRDWRTRARLLLSTCNIEQEGMIITTIDVENPAVSQPFGDPNFAMLSNLLDFHLTPYPDGFEIAEGFELTIDEQFSPSTCLPEPTPGRQSRAPRNFSSDSRRTCPGFMQTG